MQSTITPNILHILFCPVLGFFTTAAVATGSVDDDSAAALTGDFTESPALEEVQLEQEVEEEGAQTETLGNEYGKGTRNFLLPEPCHSS